MDSPFGKNIRERANWLFRASYMLMFGLLMASIDGQKLLSARFPHSPWNRALVPLDLVFLIWMTYVLWLSLSDVGAKSRLSREDALAFVLAVCVGLVVWLAKPPLGRRPVGDSFRGIVSGRRLDSPPPLLRSRGRMVARQSRRPEILRPARPEPAIQCLTLPRRDLHRASGRVGAGSLRASATLTGRLELALAKSRRPANALRLQ